MSEEKGEFEKRIADIYKPIHMIVSLSKIDIERIKKELSERKVSEDIIVPAEPHPKDVLFDLIEEARREFPSCYACEHYTGINCKYKAVTEYEACPIKQWRVKWFGSIER